MIAELGIVLAAGGSTRMGEPKALLAWGEGTLVAAHVAALRPHVAEVLVVEGAVVLPDLDATRIVNDAWASTFPADSLRLALAARPAATSALVTPVDTVPVSASTLIALAGEGSAVPVDREGRPGHPVRIAGRELAAMRAASPEGGLRTLLVGARRVSVCEAWVALDFDEPDTYRRVRESAIGH
ncbi:MAG: hypothetical protein EP330_02695 [Deltaproteobacteria bacterium]|nr:MAG: hypothetical protein EP330_02695 [Deltaproteobacteria bacterium]